MKRIFLKRLLCNICKSKKNAFLLVFLMSLFMVMLRPSHAGEEELNILILHSYHNGFLWTDTIQEGIEKNLVSTEKNIVYYTEYLDWKRFQDVGNIQMSYEHYKYKYRNTRIDVIITSDDAALDFALKYREELFSDAPIVFSGIFEERAQNILHANDNITGVIEEVDPVNTMKYAININPNINKVYLICEKTESGIAIENMLINTLRNNFSNLEVVSLSNESLEDIETIVQTVEPNSILFMGAYNRDQSGKHFGSEILVGRISKSSKVPLYTVYDYMFGTGAIGGSLLSGHLQGENAAKLAAEILSGIQANDLTIISKEKSFTPQFDYLQLQRFNVSEERLPKNAELIHKKLSFFQQYRFFVNIAIGILAFLLILVIALYGNIIRRKKSETLLVNKNQEVTDLYETVSASEEELRQQYDEISSIKDSLAKSEERYRLAAEGSKDALWDWDILKGKMHLSTRWYELLGYKMTADRSVKIWQDKIHPEDFEFAVGEMNKHLKKKTDYYMVEHRIRTSTGDYKWFLARGKAVWNLNDEAVRFAGSMTDITERKQNDIIVEQLAYYDTLTGLPNRVQAIEIIELVILDERKKHQKNALLFIDIDNFKYINDTFGHFFGDKILIRVADKIKTLISDRVKVARLGGDEFIVFILDTNFEEVESYAKNILTLFNQNIEIDSIINYVTVSIGVSIYPDHASSYNELMQYADTAMYKAKAAGKTRYEFFDATVHKELLERVMLEGELRKAVNKKEFILHYQPQIDTHTGKIRGVEALIRWISPEYGLISPGKFIPIAEETGQIIEIGNFVLKSAAEFSKRLSAMGFDDLLVSVNVSINQMKEKRFTDKFMQIMKDCGVEPDRLVLEITESVLIESFDEIRDKLKLLRDKGFKIALDDFGKGYSSLTYLKRLPISTLKIDKAFIDDILIDDTGKALTISIIEIAHQLGLNVIAEGVEVREQFEFLSQNNCDTIQGYYFSRPIVEEELLKLLDKNFIEN